MRKKHQRGFTLIEIVVVFGILGILLATVLVFLNPSRQLGKTSDAKRLSDLKQMQGALDLYYNDMNCYPQSLEFDTNFASGSAVYMQHVPQSADCTSDPTMCYAYQSSGSCPQWYVLYAKLANQPQDPDAICSLRSIGNCTPADYNSSVACFSQGTVSCPTIRGSTIGLGPTPTPTLTPSPTPSLTPTLTPTPTRTPTPTMTLTPTPVIYTISGNVWYDRNDNCVKDATESTMPNTTFANHVWVRLYNGTTLVTQTQIPTTSGNYTIANVTNGITYNLQVYYDLGGYTVCTPSPYPVTIPANQPSNFTQNFGFKRP